MTAISPPSGCFCGADDCPQCGLAKGTLRYYGKRLLPTDLTPEELQFIDEADEAAAYERWRERHEPDPH